MNNVRTDSLIIKDVRKTGREPAVNRVMSTPVRRDGFMLLPDAAPGIILTEPAVRPLPLPDVRPITASTAMPPAGLQALTSAVTPVTVVVPMSALPGPRTIPALMPLLPNAAQPVITAKTALPAKLIIPGLMPGRPNAEPVIIATIPAATAAAEYHKTRRYNGTLWGALWGNRASIAFHISSLTGDSCDANLARIAFSNF